MLIINLLCIIIAFFLVKRRMKKYDSYVNHLTIFVTIWIIVTVGSQLTYGELILPETVLLYYLSLFCYILGSYILTQPKTYEVSNKEFSSKKIKIILILLVILCSIANYDIIKEVIINFKSIQTLVLMRNKNEFSEIDESNIFKAIFQRAYLIYIPMGILLLKNKKISKPFFIFLVVTGIILSLAKFTRAPFLNLLVMILVSYVYIYRVKLPFKFIVFSVLMVFVIFSITTFFLVKSSDASESITEQIQVYLFGGQLVFQDILNGSYIDNYLYDSPYYSLDFLNYILKKLGFIETYPSYVREWSNTIVTNTYTFLDCFTLDLGIFGIIVGSFVIGFISDYSYKQMKKNNMNVYNIIFYGYICYFNVFVFANNEFIRFTLVLILFVLLIINFFSKKIRFYAD